MPFLPGCEEAGSTQEKSQCSNEKINAFIQENLKYPEEAQKNGIEGVVVVQLLIDKTGRIQKPTVVKDIGGQCGAEALRLVKLMAQKDIHWIPGQQDGQAEIVEFNLPVKFSLAAVTN